MKEENYWSLILESAWVQAAIWKLDDSVVHILSVGKPSSISEDEFIESADAALSHAIGSFPEDEKEPSRTVFGVPPSWVSDGQINKDHLEKIRQLCSKLSLSPTGFVVLPEAIAHSVKIQEGSPLTGVIIGVSATVIDVTLFKLGNIIGSVNVGRSVSLIEDVIEGLARFTTKDPVPTRILLYNGKESELEKIKQELISVDWSEKSQGRIKFLHTPQFEIIDPERKAIAVSIAGASEMGDVKEVSFQGNSIVGEKKHDQNVDVEEESNVSRTQDLTGEDIGFVIDEDIAEVEVSTGGGEKEAPDKAKKTSGNGTLFSKLKSRLPHFSLPKKGLAKTEKKVFAPIHKPKSRVKMLAISGAIILILGVFVGFAAWWYVPKAEVVIYVSPQTLEESEALTLDENIDSPLDEMTFPAETLSVEVSSSKSRQTTGTKTVGDKSSGSVKIRNGTGSGVAFDSGDVLVGPNELKFVLSESASVSAALSPTEPGEVTVNAEAFDIGAEYNLASGESFSVGSYSKSEIDAVVESDFSGGNSREIVAVSQSDLNTLREELEEDLRRKGIEELENKSVDVRFVPDSVRIEVVDTTFSNSVGDEASSISLDMQLLVYGIGVASSTVENLINEVLSPQVPDGFKLRTDQVDVDFILVENIGDGVYDFDVDLKANLLPEVDLETIKQDVKGRYPYDAEAYLANIPGYISADVRLSPRFPGRLGVIPRIDVNITVEIVAER